MNITDRQYRWLMFASISLIGAFTGAGGAMLYATGRWHWTMTVGMLLIMAHAIIVDHVLTIQPAGEVA